MDIGEIISDSIKYPSSNWGKVLILGVIMIASILIVPVFLLIGYLFRIIKATLAGLDELPDFHYKNVDFFAMLLPFEEKKIKINKKIKKIRNRNGEAILSAKN